MNPGDAIADLFDNLPKLLGVTDDLRRMADYINELRLLTFFIVGSSYIGGFLYLMFRWYKYRQHKQKKRRQNSDRFANHYDPEGAYYHNNTMTDSQGRHVRVTQPFANQNGYATIAQMNGGKTMLNGGGVDCRDGYRETNNPLEDISARRMNENVRVMGLEEHVKKFQTKFNAGLDATYMSVKSRASLSHGGNGVIGGPLPSKDANASMQNSYPPSNV